MTAEPRAEGQGPSETHQPALAAVVPLSPRRATTFLSCPFFCWAPHLAVLAPSLEAALTLDMPISGRGCGSKEARGNFQRP